MSSTLQAICEQPNLRALDMGAAVVLGLRDGFEVLRVNAQVDSAEVVQGKPFRDGFSISLIGESVGTNELLSATYRAEHECAVGTVTASPQPTVAEVRRVGRNGAIPVNKTLESDDSGGRPASLISVQGVAPPTKHSVVNVAVAQRVADLFAALYCAPRAFIQWHAQHWALSYQRVSVNTPTQIVLIAEAACKRFCVACSNVTSHLRIIT